MRACDLKPGVNWGKTNEELLYNMLQLVTYKYTFARLS